MSTGTASRPAPECRPGPAAGSGEGVTSPYWLLVAGLIPLGIGMGAATTPATAAITEGLPAPRYAGYTSWRLVSGPATS